MPLIYRFPANVVMDTVVQEYMVERDKFIGEEILPFVETMAQKVRWDEKDRERGMTAAHRLGTDPKINTRRGSKVREYEPIYFKESDVIREDELLEARQLGTLGGVVDLHQLIGQTIRDREDKNFIRAEYLRWRALQGAIHVHENGVNVDETFPIQTYDAITDWDNRAAATPLKDFNAVKLLFRGTGASAEGATAYGTQTTINWLLENTNANDIRQFRTENFRDVTFSLDDVNKIMGARGLPSLKVYDQGFIDDDDDVETFIDDGNLVVVGKRPGTQKVGDVVMTPSLHRQKNGVPQPGMFAIITVNGKGNPGALEVSMADLGADPNPRVEVTGGFYGGPRIRYPRSVVKMIVKH